MTPAPNLNQNFGNITILTWNSQLNSFDYEPLVYSVNTGVTYYTANNVDWLNDQSIISPVHTLPNTAPLQQITLQNSGIKQGNNQKLVFTISSVITKYLPKAA